MDELDEVRALTFTPAAQSNSKPDSSPSSSLSSSSSSNPHVPSTGPHASHMMPRQTRTAPSCVCCVQSSSAWDGSSHARCGWSCGAWGGLGGGQWAWASEGCCGYAGSGGGN